MRIFIFLIIMIIIAITFLTYSSYKAGYEIGKRSVILNPKLTGEDLIRDFRDIVKRKR